MQGRPMNGRNIKSVFPAGLIQDLITITINSQCTQLILPDHFHEPPLGKNKKRKKQTHLMSCLIPFSLLLGLTCSTVYGDIIYVKSDASGLDGTSWTHAYTTLQSALTIAQNNDQIWVAAGTYTPTDDYELDIGNRGKHFRMINGVAIYGGFAGWEDPNVFNLAERDFVGNETILSGEVGIVAEPNDNSYHVFYHPLQIQLDATAILDGFTVTDGNANSEAWPHYAGGGMFNQYSSPTVTNCTFTENVALYGGGMYNTTSNPTISNCIFSNNSASGDVLDEPAGGGLSNDYCNPIVTHCTFTGNTALYGAGMDNYFSNPLVFNCFFNLNSAEYGGGMNNVSGSPFVTHCTFSDNTATGNIYSGGGGISNFLQEGLSGISNPTIRDCIFSDNSAVYGAGIDNEYRDTNVTDCTFTGNVAQDGGGIYSFYSSPTVTACTLNGNTADFGGGMSNEDSNSLVVNCIFIGNTAQDGGGMQNFSNSNTIVTNCTFTGNTADYGGAMENDMSSPSISNSILWGNIASVTGNEIYNDLSNPTISYSDILGGLPTGSINGGGNIAEDPLFLEIPDDGGDGWGDANDNDGDLRLQGGSPCIDAGNNTIVPVEVTTDFDGKSRYVDDPTVVDTGNGTAPIVDMGAYESDDPCLGRDKSDFDCNGIVNMADFVYFASSWLQ
jgi:predicted outer membrane repeat protein